MPAHRPKRPHLCKGGSRNGIKGNVRKLQEQLAALVQQIKAELDSIDGCSACKYGSDVEPEEIVIDDSDGDCECLE